MDKIDPYDNKGKYLSWKNKLKEKGIKGICKENEELLLRYISDMESGLNVATTSRKGARSFIRLNTLRLRIILLMREFEKRYNKKLIEISEEQIHAYFQGMRNGEINKKNGQSYKSVRDYIRDFKAFWHWWQKINRKKGVEIEDITLDLDTSRDKPKWVYLTEEEVKEMAEKAKYDYKVLILFLFDSGIRAPTELLNLKISDFFNDFKEVNIRQEISKTFGRRIKLMLCSTILNEYVKKKKLTKDSPLFDFNPYSVNKYLKRLSKTLFGGDVSPAGEKYSNLSMYDFRHCSCCYWLPRYKSESALKYRFGWKESDRIHYYSELLGMKDTISEEDLLVDTTKTELEQRLETSEKEKEVLQERMKTMEMQMAKIMELTKQLGLEVKNG